MPQHDYDPKNSSSNYSAQAPKKERRVKSSKSRPQELGLQVIHDMLGSGGV